MKFAAGRVWPALLTPLDAQGEPDLENLERLVDLLAGQDLGGLFILGSTGQGVSLTSAERQRVAEHTIRTAAGRLPVMVHVGTTTTAESVRLARHAAEVGADAISTVPPIYYPATFQTTLEHYRQVASASDLPFFPYHASFLAQSLPAAPEYAERLLGLPNIQGMKFTDHNMIMLGLLAAYTGGRLHLLSGADELLCHAAVSGANGAIGTFYNLWGPECQKVRQAFVAGDTARGRDFMVVFQRALYEIVTRGLWSFLEAAMQHKHGISVGRPRAPLGASDTPWDPAEVERLLHEVEAAAG